MRYHLIPGVVCACIFDEYFLAATMEARKTVSAIRELNETGAFFWKLLEQQCDLDAAVERTTQEYEVSAADARAAFEAFTAELCAAGYLILEDEP